MKQKNNLLGSDSEETVTGWNPPRTQVLLTRIFHFFYDIPH